MVAIFVTALVALAGLAALGSLADSGLRWWSALGQLRRELRGELAIQQQLSTLRPAIVQGGFSGFDRAGSAAAIRQTVRRAA